MGRMAHIRPRDETVRPGYERLRVAAERPLQVLVSLAALGTLPVLIEQERDRITPLVTAADWVIWVVFLVELVVMGLCAANRRRYLLQNWVGVAVVVLSFPALPHLLAAVRVVRLTRLVRLARVFRLLAVTARGMKALRHSVGGQTLLYLGSLSLLLTVSGGALLAVLEPDTVRDGFWGGVWWAVVTLTTVGYGDIAPTTIGGRLLAILLMLCGLGLLSTLAASISAYFVGESDASETAELRERLDRIERKLDEILREREK